MAVKEKPCEGELLEGRHTLAVRNYWLMLAAGVVIVVGFLLMLGSPSTEETYNPGIYSTRRIVIGPLVAFLGYVFMGFAIMWQFKNSDAGEGAKA